MDRSVAFPAPLGPRRPKMAPRGPWRLTPRSASVRRRESHPIGRSGQVPGVYGEHDRAMVPPRVSVLSGLLSRFLTDIWRPRCLTNVSPRNGWVFRTTSIGPTRYSSGLTGPLPSGS